MKTKQMYKVEIRHLDKIRSVLRSGKKLNGNTVMLGDTNTKLLIKACIDIQSGIDKLSKIEAYA